MYTEDAAPRPRTASARLRQQKPATVELPHRARPYDLWKAAHEVTELAKPPKKLSAKQWDGLVGRLSASSREKEMHLLRNEHQRIAEELKGQRFTPHICKQSRKLAATNKGLPDRLGSLLRTRTKKIDQIRHEQAQKQLAEVTFHPKINEKSQRLTRKVANLTKYAEIKKIRAQQRRQIMQEVEDRELTFAPQINRLSLKLVEKRKAKVERKKREEEVAAAVGVKGSASVASRKTARAKRDPGHEEETFKPKINSRSRTVPRGGRNVFDRLSAGNKMGRIESSVHSVVTSATDARDPQFFNVVAYKPDYDFVVRRLQGADA